MLLPIRTLTACMLIGACLSMAAQTRPVLQAAPAVPDQAGDAPQAGAPGQAQSPTSGTGTADDGILPGPSSNSYIITTGDTLKVSVWKEPDMSNASIPVRPDGMISLPLLGDVQASTLTPMQLSQNIQVQLKKYATDPLVTVTLVSAKPKSIYVMGEVAHTGPVVLSPAMTPLQAIAAAGGVTSYANLKAVYILRKSGTAERKIPFNYKRAIKSGDLQGVTLMPDDTIVIP
jgi:polysaccharide export outer membrane protein